MSNTESAATKGCDLLILKCPSCGGAEPIEAAVMAEGTQIVVCRLCGEAWPARQEENSGASAIEKAEQAGRSLVWSDARMIDAVRRPLASYDNGSHDAWAARIAAESAPAPASSPAGQGFIMAVAALVSVAFLTAFFAARESAVAAVPDLAGLYERIGLPVNLQGLEISELAASRQKTGAGTTVTVTGALVNLRDSDQPVPDLVVELRDSAHGVIRQMTLAPPVPKLTGLDSRQFEVIIGDAPNVAADVAVRFRQTPELRRSVAGEVAAGTRPDV